MSKEFGFTPAQVWDMEFGEFIGYHAYAKAARERNQKRARENRAKKRG